MRLLRGFTNKEWMEISEKYKDGGVHMYRGKKTLFYNGEKLWQKHEDPEEEGWPRVYDYKERRSWEVIIILPGVETIHYGTFHACRNVKTVIMAIKDVAFHCCYGLEFVRLSRNLEYIGKSAYYSCQALTSVFIPPSCRKIDNEAFFLCKQLAILGLPQHTELGRSVFQYTPMIKASPIETDYDGCYYRTDENEEEAVRWVKSINYGDACALHRACASFNPLSEIIHDLVKRQSINAMRMKNKIGITPSQYLAANTFADVSEKEIINRYISDMMGEVF
ncbi:hypothetical protein CTEN210_13434 [Chaetoceros tenuissimus]|uniref:Leucine-rich repeat domain-containing protein n=1 Tax=Chaetoceros tenuissimus TaxID=426638 RepID=A0AAD3HBF5_9STRA|nr:hypothetical protein CTEN210_13431 [Chaetoceros tenuissimus]GFH56958.1 hypothetical protein CTEN210_13434 [Chaetoceros tenuissimus]